MLVYHPAFDLYNCIFRILSLLKYSKEEEVHFDKMRIWDFYLVFPNEVKSITFPEDLRKLKEKVFKQQDNPYEKINDPKRVFERMKTYQLSAVKCLASYGLVDSKLLTRNIVKRTSKAIPDTLGVKLEDLPDEKMNVIKLVTNDFINLPLYGRSGLKARTGLIDFKYDPRN